LTKISIFDQNFDFWPKLDFWPKFGFLAKISIFDQNFDFWPRFWPKLDFWPKFWFLAKISILNQNFNFWGKFRFLTKSSIFQNFHFDLNFDFDQNFNKISRWNFKLSTQITNFKSFSPNEGDFTRKNTKKRKKRNELNLETKNSMKNRMTISNTTMWSINIFSIRKTIFILNTAIKIDGVRFLTGPIISLISN